jgi:uncharacterized protein (TIGR03067 family)
MAAMLCFTLFLFLGLGKVSEPGAAPVERLISQLGDPVFRQRKQASLALIAVGEAALPAVRRAAARSADVEIRHRAGQLIPVLEAARAAADTKRSQGTWSVVFLKLDGEAINGGPWLDKARVIIHGEHIEFQNLLPNDDYLTDGSFALDVHQEPAAIDLTFLFRDDRHPECMCGIYEFHKGTLKLCLGGRPLVRPRTFESRKDSRALLLTLKRRGP